MRAAVRTPSRHLSTGYVCNVVAKLTLVRNPAGDVEFEQALNSLVESGMRDPAAVQEALRERYPLAVVRPRELEAESAPTWYVYREGRWTRE
jgi:hypothetical protein